MKLFQAKMGTDPQLFVNNVGGTYYFIRTGAVTVMVDRNVMHVVSDIVSEDTDVYLELPSHPEFYLTVVGPGETEYIRIEKDAALDVTVKKDYQIQALCAL